MRRSSFSESNNFSSRQIFINPPLADKTFRIMANPVLNENVFRKENVVYGNTGVMTVGGTATKTLLMLLMVVAGAAYTWKLYYNAVSPQSIVPWMWGGIIGAFIMAMIISFKPKAAQYLAPIYAAGEGLALGGISAIFNEQFALTAPNIVVNAVAQEANFVLKKTYEGLEVKFNEFLKKNELQGTYKEENSKTYLTFIGVAAHASTPWLGKNALAYGLKFLADNNISLLAKHFNDKFVN